MRILVFSDIHSDLGALRKLIAIDADYYASAGDLVSWERGLDPCGEILKAKSGKDSTSKELAAEAVKLYDAMTYNQRQMYVLENLEQPSNGDVFRLRRASVSTERSLLSTRMPPRPNFARPLA